jgi:hypothetical protein
MATINTGFVTADPPNTLFMKRSLNYFEFC